MADSDFYEEDEPVEEVVEAFERGEKFFTWPHGTTTWTYPVGKLTIISSSPLLFR